MKLLGQAISEVQKAEKNTKAVGKSINKAETAFKELGVKEPKNFVGMKEAYKSNLKMFTQTISEIKKAKIY